MSMPVGKNSGCTYDCGNAAAMTLAQPTPIWLPHRLMLVNALLIFGTIPFHEGKSGHKLVNIGRTQTKSISNNTQAAGGDTYDCGSESAMALAPPAPIPFARRLSLVNALLTTNMSAINSAPGAVILVLP